MTCHEPIGYTAPDGAYRGATECPKCQGGTVELRLATSGISEREINRSLDDMKPRDPEGKAYTDHAEWMAFLRSFAALTPGAKLYPPFAFVCGNNGVGKSAGAQRALRDAIRNGCQGRFIRLSAMLRSIYATYDSDNQIDESTEERVNFYSRVHLLVIDDVGQTAIREHAMGLFFDIVDDRWRNNRPTIFTANYLPQSDSLGARMTVQNDERVAMQGVIDRLRGGAEANVFTIRGKSWRGHEELS